MWTVRDCPRTVWVVNGIICAINHVLMCMRPEMAMDSGSQSGTDVERVVVNSNSRVLLFM